MSERHIQQAILATFGARPDVRLWRTNTGKAKMGDRGVQFNPPGLPDICGIITVHGYGVAIGIEVKSATGKQSDEQKAFQRCYEKMGALYILARSVACVSSAITAFRLVNS